MRRWVEVGSEVGELGGGVGEQVEEDDQDGALQRDQGLGLGHAFDQPSVAFAEEGVGLRGAGGDLGERGFEVGVASAGAGPAGLAPGLHGARGDPGPGAQPLRGAEHAHVQADLAEDRADRVRAAAGDRAQPGDGRVVPGLRWSVEPSRSRSRLGAIGLVAAGWPGWGWAGR